MYFITAIEIKDNEYKGSNCVGYVDSLLEAIEILQENRDDINETIYDYAVIENIPQGIYQIDQNPIYFKFNYKEHKYERCNKPESLGRLVGFAIG